MLTISNLSSLKGIKHGFCTRQGGVSQGLFSSKNCAFEKGDPDENVFENRQRALGHLDLQGKAILLTAKQIHSNHVLILAKPWTGAAPETDALITREPGLALGVLTADCVPVLLCDPTVPVVGAVHAGWRGALQGIVAEAIQAMERLGASSHRIVAGIGPCIAQQSYEVGPEVLHLFQEKTALKINDLFTPSDREAHFLFDLPVYVELCLRAAGIHDIENTLLDTYSHPKLFFSCRRATHAQEPTFGNQVSIIAIL